MKPVGKRVLVKEVEQSQETESGIILAPNARKDIMAEGVVLEIPENLADDVKIPVDIGDRILYNRNTALVVAESEKVFTVQFDSIVVKY